MSQNGSYITKSDKYKDNKFSGFMFIILGIILILFSLFSYRNIIPIKFTDFFYIGSIILTIVFELIGIFSLKSCHKLKHEANDESSFTEMVIKDFIDNNNRDYIDSQIEGSDDENQLFFERTQVINDILSNKYPDVSEEYLESLNETIYDLIYTK